MLSKNALWLLVFIVTSFLQSEICNAQNLVPNPSFEDYTECPPSWNQGEPLQCTPWVQGNLATADYFHTCASPGDAGVPVNFGGIQWPVSGEAYTGLIACWGALENRREYIQAPLDMPLTPGAGYLVTFYVSLADEYCPTKPFGALFTNEPPIPDGLNVLSYTPQIEVNGGFLSDYSEWMIISRCFIAEGGEQYITIGNFRDDAESPVDTNCVIDTDRSYYYVDSVTVVSLPVSEDDFILEPVSACDSYTILPGSAQNYLWEDGTTNPTLTVFESGTYHVTLSDACAFSYGEIEVTIIPSSPPVTLPNDTLLCAGELIEISLDQDAGDYEWHDGSTNNEYTISTDGICAVTLTDNCDETADTIIVDFMEAPEIFSLGEDTLICNGDAFTISFDPAMGEFMWQDGSNNASYTINDDGTYGLTISNMCGQAEDEINVEFIEPIVFSIGPDQTTLCDGDAIEIVLDPLLGDFLWNDNSTGNTYTISGEGTVSVTITNACESVSDEMLVSVLYAPEFTLGPDVTVCSGQFPITLNMSDVDHAQSWEWSGGSTQSVYQVTGPGTYSVTISNDCFAVTDDIVISVGDADPVVTLPADQLLCPGQTYVLDAGGLEGSYQWAASTGSVSDADTFLVMEAGTYYLTVTNICGSGSDSVIINYIPALSPPDLGADFSLCPGETEVLYANVDDVSNLWTDVSTGSTSPGDSLIITNAGVYVLQIADACSNASDTIVISSNANPPDVDLPEPIDLCSGDTVIVDAGITGVQYQWEGGTTLSSLAIHVPGTYSLTVSNACGSDIDSVIINDAGFPPFVDLGDDFSLCEGDSFILHPPMAFVDTWLWHASTGSATTDSFFIVDTAGTITVEVANSCGNAADTTVVTMLPAVPVLDLGADLSLCSGETITLSITELDVDILWNDASTGNEFVADEEGIVYATISNTCGSSSDTVFVELLPDVPALELGEDQSLCPGETITLDPGIPDVTYLWQNGSNASTFQTTQPGTIILIISNACGTTSDTLEIIENTNGPELDLGPDIVACEGDTVILVAGISGVEYLWSNGCVAAQCIATISGVYSLQVTNACGSDSDTIIVEINGTIPMPSLGLDTTLCDEEILVLHSDADAETEIEWSDGSDAPSLMVSGAGVYILYESNHCGSASDTIEVGYQSAPLPFDLGEDIGLCPGESIALNAPVTTGLITWSDGSHGASIIADAEQSYSLVISNECGEVTDEVDVSFDTNEPVVELGPSQALCPGQAVMLDVTQAFSAEYLWSTGSTLSTVHISEPDVYTVTVSTECYSVLDDVLIEQNVDCNSGIYVPNVFSPNGDNINDEWIVLFDDASITGIECRIFDRWGDVVYETTDMTIVWNGKVNNQEQNPGVFAYIIILKKEEGTQSIISGDITLVR